MKKAGFEETHGTGGSNYNKGRHRVEVSQVGEKQHVKYFVPGHKGGSEPVFHTDANVQPQPEFMQKFLSGSMEEAQQNK